MLDKIEIRLIDDQGNYSIAHINYKGYVDMLIDHNIDMVHDSLQAMTNNFSTQGKLEIKVNKDLIAEHEKFRAPHKH